MRQRILVIDDEPIMMEAMVNFLRQVGYIVYVSNQSWEVEVLIDGFQPDLIITDIMMPYRSGLEIVEELSKGSNKHIPVIITSALAEETLLSAAYQLGAKDFFDKTWSLKKLQKKIENLLTLDQCHY